jgi:hypothetical protein
MDIGELVSDLKSSSILRAKSPLQKTSLVSDNIYIMQKLSNSISNDPPKDKEF